MVDAETFTEVNDGGVGEYYDLHLGSEEPPYDAFYDEPPYDPFYDETPPFIEPESALYSASNIGSYDYGEINPQLTKDQRAVVEHLTGPLVVIAGPGAGKTQTLIERNINLLRNGASPMNIYAVTFTNKAANEMKERLRAKIGDVAGSVNISTFHGLASRIYRADAPRLGLRSDATFISTSSQKTLIKKLLKEKGYDKDVQARSVASSIDHAKRSLEATTLEGLITTLEDNEAFEAAQIAGDYQKYMQENNRMDFNDVLLYAYALLQIPEVAEKWARRVQHLVADEYQDTDHVQHEIIRVLGSAAQSVMVVGDTDQTIYCQPYGTKVLVPTSSGYSEVPIETLTEGSLVGSSSTFKRKSGKEITGLWDVEHDGLMIRATVQGEETNYTPNHRCIVRLGGALTGKRVTYVFQYGNNLYGHVVTDNFNESLNRYSADVKALWVLRAAKTSAYIGPAYPDHVSLGLNRGKIQALMREAGVDYDTPLLMGGMLNHAVVKGREFVTAAQNLISGMRLPKVSEKLLDGLTWEVVRVSRYDYKGRIVSLSVADDHNYIADGILTHNSWRGADPIILREFKKDFPNTKIITINDNFRSSPEILKVVRHAIAPIEVPERSSLFPHKAATGKKPVVEFYDTQNQEAAAIATWAKNLVVSGVKPSEIAVLFRTNFAATPIERAVNAARLPYTIVGSPTLYESVRIKSILDWFKMAFWQDDALTFETLASNQLKGLGTKTIEKMVEEAKSNNKGNIVWYLTEEANTIRSQQKAPSDKNNSITYFAERINLIVDTFNSRGLSAAIEECFKAVPPEYWEKRDITTDSRTEALQILLMDAENFKPDQRYKFTKETGFMVSHPVYGDSGTLLWNEDEEQWEADFLLDVFKDEDAEPNLFEQDKGMVNFVVPESILHEVFLKEDADEGEMHSTAMFLEGVSLGSASDGDGDTIQLSTLHKAKGREFDHVWLAGVSNRVLPLTGQVRDGVSYLIPDDEERRLFFVGVSRARKELVISGHNVSSGFSPDDSMFRGPSKFLYELQDTVDTVIFKAKLKSPLRSQSNTWKSNRRMGW